MRVPAGEIRNLVIASASRHLGLLAPQERLAQVVLFPPYIIFKVYILVSGHSPFENPRISFAHRH
jgi:hypothetical protein